MSEAKDALEEWRDDVEQRAKGRQRAVRRGTKTGPGVAAGSWRCEGCWQPKDQMDIWECLDEVERDQMRQHEINDLEAEG